MAARLCILSAILLLFCPSLHADEDWTYVTREEKVKDFQLNQKGKLQYKGAVLDGFSLQTSADRVAISPPAPTGSYSVLFAFGDESQCFLLDLDKHVASPMTLGTEPLIWNSWSPESTFVLLGNYSENGTNLHLVTLSSKQTRNIPISLNREGEIQELDTGTVMWTAPDVFEVEATIHCKECDTARQEVTIRKYISRVNVSSFEVTTEEQPLQ